MGHAKRTQAAPCRQSQAPASCPRPYSLSGAAERGPALAIASPRRGDRRTVRRRRRSEPAALPGRAAELRGGSLAPPHLFADLPSPRWSGTRGWTAPNGSKCGSTTAALPPRELAQGCRSPVLGSGVGFETSLLGVRPVAQHDHRAYAETGRALRRLGHLRSSALPKRAAGLTVGRCRHRPTMSKHWVWGWTANDGVLSVCVHALSRWLVRPAPRVHQTCDEARQAARSSLSSVAVAKRSRGERAQPTVGRTHRSSEA